MPKRKKSAVQSYSLNRSACKILGDQPDKKRKKMIMNVLGMDVLSVNFSQASMDDANVLSFPSATSSFMKEAIKAAKVVIKKQDVRIKELEKLDDNESIAEMESNNDDEDHEDDEDVQGHDDSDAPVAAELGPKDVMIGVHFSKCSSHPGNMRATELALQYYKEYCVTKSYVVKRALVTNLIQRLVNEGHRFLMKMGNEWMTMSDDQTHVKFLKMMTNLNSNKEWAGRVKVKPAMIVKLNKSKWNDNDRKILQEYVIENDDDDFCMWDHIATMLNRSERACKSQMRKILDCGIYVEEKEGELIVFLYCFNIEINCLICGVLCA